MVTFSKLVLYNYIKSREICTAIWERTLVHVKSLIEDLIAQDAVYHRIV